MKRKIQKIINKNQGHNLTAVLWINPRPFLARARILCLFLFSSLISCIEGEVVDIVDALSKASEFEL